MDVDALLGLMAILVPALIVGAWSLFGTKKNSASGSGHDLDDLSTIGSAFNINGLPMVGCTDINGNPHGTF